MIDLDVSGFGQIQLEHLVSDFTGTLSVDGKLLPGVRGRLRRIAKLAHVHVLTADTFGKARQALAGIPCEIHIIAGKGLDRQKQRFVEGLGAKQVVAFGNGNNDRRMLKAARLGIAVSEGEGGAVDAILAADIHVRKATDGLDLLLKPKRLKATLHY